MSKHIPQENQYDTRECIVHSAVNRSHGAVEYVNLALSAFRGADKYSFDRTVENAEEAYLSTYMAWQAEKGDTDSLKAAHEEAKSFRDKVLEIKKLMDELECEGDRLLQSLHSLRT